MATRFVVNGTLTIHRSYTCGHTETVSLASNRGDETREQTQPFLCGACRANPAIVAAQPLWQRNGYASEAAYEAAAEHSREVAAIEHERNARIADLFARPESARPFRTRAPLSGQPTLDDVAREDGEED